MKSDIPKTNYLAGAQSSDYDVLQRRIAVLIQHWMDHTSGVRPSRLIALLCEYIDSTQFKYLKCNEEELFSTKSDFFLGLIISHFLEIQDEKGDNIKSKRQELEEILNHFAVLHLNSGQDKINLKDINSKQESLLPETDSDPQPRLNWKLKFLDFFTKIR